VEHFPSVLKKKKERKGWSCCYFSDARRKGGESFVKPDQQNKKEFCREGGHALLGGEKKKACRSADASPAAENSLDK